MFLYAENRRDGDYREVWDKNGGSRSILEEMQEDTDHIWYRYLLLAV